MWCLTQQLFCPFVALAFRPVGKNVDFNLDLGRSMVSRETQFNIFDFTLIGIPSVAVIINYI